MARFLHEIPLKELPKTFQEAIYVTRYPGLQYIWIDSLCILQDSSEDWAKESVHMADVNGAAEAADGSGGCFFERSDSWRTQVSASAQVFERFPKVIPPFQSSSEENYLAKQAWIVQERYLSRRTLNFARDMLYWECAEGTCCEIHPRTWPSHSHFYAFQSQLPKYRLEITDWSTLVEQYSHAKLTNLTDKLVAIAGIAKAVRHERAGEYIAGL
jgi:hypothetical protein